MYVDHGIATVFSAKATASRIVGQWRTKTYKLLRRLGAGLLQQIQVIGHVETRYGLAISWVRPKDKQSQLCPIRRLSEISAQRSALTETLTPHMQIYMSLYAMKKYQL